MPKEATEMLALRHIPKEFNSIEALDKYFRQFGTVVRASCDTKKGNAIVEMENAAAAHRAHSYGQPFGVKEMEMVWCRGDHAIVLKAMRSGTVPPPEPKKKVVDATPTKKAKTATAASPATKLTPGGSSNLTFQNESAQPTWKSVADKKKELLDMYTKQLQKVMQSMRQPGLNDAKKNAYHQMLVTIKEKMNDVAAGGPAAKEKQVTPNKLVNENKYVHLRIPRLPDDMDLGGLFTSLTKHCPAEYIADVCFEDASRTQVLVKFYEKSQAQLLYDERDQLPFELSWWEVEDVLARAEALMAEEPEFA